MERSYEEHYHRVEARHWWFCARRAMVSALVRQLAPDRRSRILDIGCSSGLLLEELSRRGYAEVQGIDASPEGVALAQRAGMRARVMDAHRPEFPEGAMEVITASDVLEHLEQDANALREWRRVLKPGGRLIVFVPAFRWLWTDHDTVNRHFRRYTRSELIRLLTSAGFAVERGSYWNTALFFPVALLRLWRRRSGRKPGRGDTGSDMFLPPIIVNGLLRLWLGLENGWHRCGLNSPVGVSVMVIARRPVGTFNNQH